MASFTFLIRSAPFASGQHQIALDFLQEAVAQGHRIDRVFFYQDAVYCGLNSLQPVQGQPSVTSQWQALSQQLRFPLQLCIANALRRGICNEEEQQRYNLPAVTCAEHFELSGLGEMAEACMSSDRVVEF